MVAGPRRRPGFTPAPAPAAPARGPGLDARGQPAVRAGRRPPERPRRGHRLHADLDRLRRCRRPASSRRPTRTRRGSRSTSRPRGSRGHLGRARGEPGGRGRDGRRLPRPRSLVVAMVFALVATALVLAPGAGPAAHHTVRDRRGRCARRALGRDDPTIPQPALGLLIWHVFSVQLVLVDPRRPAPVRLGARSALAVIETSCAGVVPDRIRRMGGGAELGLRPGALPR